jgi:cytochrome c-type biogenesis protein CcsB
VSRRFSTFCTLLILLAASVTARAQADMPHGDSSSLDFKQFGLLAIQEGGRRKPMDTFTRETLIRITGKSTVKTGSKRWQANDWALSMLLDTHKWAEEPMVLISLGELKTALGLPEQQRRFSFAQLSQLPELNRLASEAHALRQAEKPLSRLQQEVMNVADRMTRFMRVQDGSAFLLVPAKDKPTDPWVVPPGFTTYYTQEQFNPIQPHLQAMANAYTRVNSFDFAASAKKLRESLRALSPNIYPAEGVLTREYFYNHFDGFYRAALCYGLALVLLAIAHLRKTRGALRMIGVGVAVLGVLFQAVAITLRCFIAGRPPVTNMYESIIWVAFTVAVLGLIFFARYRGTVYLLAALPVALVSLLLVHQMPIAMPASIDPLVPVLRDNFWLTIHVLTITLSYGAFALAMGFGHILLWRYMRDPVAARADGQMHFWLYRVIQLGVLLLAAGTILGGVWANYSWGRFWGWDPKETWALIALLCYIVVLHGRLAGWWTQFGLVVASVVCFLSILMAWYGVNFVLGKGLHSYGFGIGGENYVGAFVLADLAYVGFAVWRYRASRATSGGGRPPSAPPPSVEQQTVAA